MMNSLRFLLTAILASLALTACQSPESSKPAPAKKVVLLEKKDTIRVMEYNVENLFDNIDDPGKEERDFNTWTDSDIKLKLEHLSDAILQIDNAGPDILILEEVENMNILKQLNAYLPDSKYQTLALEEGNDERGIDCAVMSRYPMISSKIHHGTFSPDPEGKPYLSRGILEVQLLLPNGSVMHVFAVHFPSLANASIYRQDAFRDLKKLLEGVPEGHLYIVGGDFNVSVEEEKNNHFYLDMMPYGSFAQDIATTKYEGTHNYRGQWSYLNGLFFAPEFLENGRAPYKVDLASIGTPKKGTYQLNELGLPKPSRKGQPGVSDHLPVYAELRLR